MEERKVLSRNYLLDPKAAFDPTHLVSTTIDGLIRIFEGKLVSAPSMALLPNLLLICDTKDARWREQTMDDDMLHTSIRVSEEKDDVKYISTYLVAVISGDIYRICITEATNSILQWMDLPDNLALEIK